MKKLIQVLILIVLLIVVGLAGRHFYYRRFYNDIDDYALKHRKWKWNYGYNIGDFLFVDTVKTDSTTFIDKNHNIYKRGIKKGRVINATSERLTIESNDGRRGYYFYF